MVKARKLSLEPIEYLRDIEVLTETIPIDHSELAPGWYYTDGSKDEKNDAFNGIWIRLVDEDGAIVAEARHGIPDGDPMPWIEPTQTQSE